MVEDEDDNLNYIKEELSHEEEFVNDYSIKAKWEMGEDPSRLMEVSRFFSSKLDLDEAGINVGSRVVLAYSPSGYQQLKDMGFTHKEIMKQYEK